MAECPGGRTGRGARSQFRLSTTRPELFHGLYPIRVGDIMDLGQSSQTGSPSRGTRTRTVREYEQTISDLKKENFDLKLRLFLYEETNNEISRQDPIQVIVKVKLDMQSLQNELHKKNELLQDALDQVKKYASDLKELEEKCAEVPSNEEYTMLLSEKDNLLQNITILEKNLTDKDEEILDINQKIELLSDQNRLLEEKVKKRDLAIQGFLLKNYQQRELRTQAAKNQDELATAVKSRPTVLQQSSPVPMSSEDKENIRSSQSMQCLKEEFFKSSSNSSSPFLPNRRESGKDLCEVQSLKECLLEASQQFQDSVVGGKVSMETPSHLARNEDFFSTDTMTRASTASVVQLAFSSSPQHSFLHGHDSIKGSNKDVRPILSVVQTDALNSSQTAIHKNLKECLSERSPQQLTSACIQDSVMGRTAVSERPSHLAPQNVVDFFSTASIVQASITSATQPEDLVSSSPQEHRAIEGIHKKVMDAKQILSPVQTNALNSSQTAVPEEFLDESSKLQERLAFTCAVNGELMRHLQSLEAFMEDLLQNKLDASLESLSEKSGFLSNVSRCLNESLKLSQALSDHLSICEGSKIFPECQSILSKSASFSEKSMQHLDVSLWNLPQYHSASNEGTKMGEECFSFIRKNVTRETLGSLSVGGSCWNKLLPMQPEVRKQCTKNTGYPSSESDIWSEPDRDVSMQRIGINVLHSPLSSKSPRKVRWRERRMSTDWNTSSSGMQQGSKQRRNDSSCRRLFTRESLKYPDLTLERYCSLLSGKLFKFKSLLENTQEEDISDDSYIKMNSMMTFISEVFQKLQAAKDCKFPGVCGKCAMLELLVNLKSSPSASEFIALEGSSGCHSKIIEDFLKEIHLLQEECEDLFSLKVDKVSKSSQTQPFEDKISKLEQTELNTENRKLMENLDKLNILLSNERNRMEVTKSENVNLLNEVNILKEKICEISSENSEIAQKLNNLIEEECEDLSALKVDQVSKLSQTQSFEDKINKLEQTELNNENRGLMENLDKLNVLLSKERNTVEVVKSENINLLNEVKNLKEKICELDKLNILLSKERDMVEVATSENVNLLNEMKSLKEKICEISSENSELAQKLDNLIKEECEDLSVLIVDQVSELSQTQSFEDKISKLEQIELNNENRGLMENLDKLNSLLSKERNMMEVVKSENVNLLNEVKNLKEKMFEISSENSELAQKLDNLIKEDLSVLKVDQVSKSSQTQPLEDKINKLEQTELNNENRKRIENFEKLNNLLTKERNMMEMAKSENVNLLNEVRNLNEKIWELSSENSELAQKLDNLIKEQCEDLSSLKVDQVSTSSQTQLFEDKINGLEQTELNNQNKRLMENLEQLNILLTKERRMMELAKSENVNLSNVVENLNEKICELSLKNSDLAQELDSMNQSYSDMKDALQNLEQKMNASNVLKEQLTAELQRNKSELMNSNTRCIEHKIELSEQVKLKEEFAAKLIRLESFSSSEKRQYLNEIENLNLEKNIHVDKLKDMEGKLQDLEKENMLLNNNLDANNNEVYSLQKSVDALETANKALSTSCSGLELALEKAKQESIHLQQKYSSYKEDTYKEYKNELMQLEEKLLSENKKLTDEISQLEEKLLSEKRKLAAEISQLSSEKDEILQNLSKEKRRSGKLTNEKSELKEKLHECCQLIDSLRLKNEEFANTRSELLQKNEVVQNDLHVSHLKCDTLSNDLMLIRGTLQNLESKCIFYEKELAASAGMKDHLVECLLNIQSEFAMNRHKLHEMCKLYESDSAVDCDEAPIFDFIPIIDEDNVNKLCENVNAQSKKLLKTIDLLLEILKRAQVKSQETNNLEKKYSGKITHLQNQIKWQKLEIEHLQSQKDELEQCVSEKDKSIESSALETQSIKEKCQNLENEIQKGTSLLKMKEDEITELLERIFNLQTYVVNRTISEKAAVNVSLSADKSIDDEETHFRNSLPSQPIPEDTHRGSVPEESADEISATSSAGKNSCCTRYLKKYYSVRTRLAAAKKCIDVLEKEKNDMRQNFLDQLETNNGDETEFGKLLEQKSVFIQELKGELLKVCNNLIDKQREVDHLRGKLSESEAKSRHSVPEPLSPKSVLANIKNLKNHKWKLIRTIFDIQKKFYEKKGIHLNYFYQFQEHVSSLYSLHGSRSLSKSESMPLLGSHCEKQGNDSRISDLMALQLDIECLENLKIFLSRFFVPCHIQNSQSKGTQTVPDSSLENSGISQKHSTEIKVGTSDAEKTGSWDFIHSPFMNAVPSFSSGVLEKCTSLPNVAASVSHHLDFVESFFKAVQKHQQLSFLDDSVTRKAEEVEIKPLLVEIFKEMETLSEGTDRLFHLNGVLRSLPVLSISKLTSKSDWSDRESVLSEETIIISRSETPLSCEESSPFKLPHFDTLQLQKQSIPSQHSVSVAEPHSPKMAIATSSCDSVCHRSHYSSPDLGIESDPNHESSVPEPLGSKGENTTAESSVAWKRISGAQLAGNLLYCIGKLQHFELLKREIQESLVGIKSVLSRTGEGLHHVGKYTSPRKTLEYNTLRAIKDTCANIEVCLKEAYKMVGEFWTAACPSEKEWNALLDENQHLCEQLARFKFKLQKRENEFKAAMEKLERAQRSHTNMEKKISKKLVKTKQVIRQTEVKLLQNMCSQNFPLVPKYPEELPTPKVL